MDGWVIGQPRRLPCPLSRRTLATLPSSPSSSSCTVSRANGVFVVVKAVGCGGLLDGEADSSSFVMHEAPAGRYSRSRPVLSLMSSVS